MRTRTSACALAVIGLMAFSVDEPKAGPSSGDRGQPKTERPGDTASAKPEPHQLGPADLEGRPKIDSALLEGKRPVVHVLSPPGDGATLSLGSEARILVVLEIIDATGADIASDDSGVPKFVEPDHNVDIFSSYVVTHRAYLNSLGEKVYQVVSEIPVDALRAGDMMMSPPVDYRHLTDKQKREGFTFPNDAMLEAASFAFRVKDLKGAESDPEAASSRLVIGFASGSYLPAPQLVPTPDPKPGSEQEKPAP